MGVFGETVPIITLGAISKRWAVPGWRLGWIAVCDPKGILRKTEVILTKLEVHMTSFSSLVYFCYLRICIILMISIGSLM
jgi:aspartate/methionine/tyrosine aminotransferase